MASVELSHLSVSHFRENSRAVETRFSLENKVRDATLDLLNNNNSGLTTTTVVVVVAAAAARISGSSNS